VEAELKQCKKYL